MYIDPIPFGRYTLHPSVTDLAGAEPWRVIDELEGYRTFRWKRKLVLVVVASPVSGNRPLSPPDRFDDAFVEQQKGYMSLPRSIIGSKNQRRRPGGALHQQVRPDLRLPGRVPVPDRRRRHLRPETGPGRARPVRGGRRRRGLAISFVIIRKGRRHAPTEALLHVLAALEISVLRALPAADDLRTGARSTRNDPQCLVVRLGDPAPVLSRARAHHFLHDLVVVSQDTSGGQ